MQRRCAILLLVSVSVLATIGMIILTSTSIFGSQASSTDGYREPKRQLVWLVLGVIACFAASRIDYRFWKKQVWWIYGGAVVLLACCFVPGIGQEINGEQRWIRLGLLQIQPSEFAKVMFAVLLATWYSRHPDSGKYAWRGFLAPLLLVSVPFCLILFEVDIGTSAVICGMVAILLFVSGVDWRYLTGLAATGVIGFLGMLNFAPERMDRMMAFLDPEKHRLGDGFQQWISLMALGSGGFFGRGVGEGRLKMLYLPFAHTDFIFPIIGEEGGLLATLLVVVCFIALVASGFSIAYHAADRFGSLLAIALVSFIGVQAFLNIGVTTSILPNTGLTLPFVSYGGSSLLVGFFSIGILINIYRQGRETSQQTAVWLSRGRITPRL